MKKAVKEGYIKLGGHHIEVAVLEDGQRVVTEKGLASFLACLQDGEFDEADAKDFAYSLSQGDIHEY